MSIPTNSRAKGCRGELDAASHLSRLTKWPWERTAQRWGKAVADIWAPNAPSGFSLHVEVKLYARGLKRIYSAVERAPLVSTLDGLYCCELSHLQTALLRHGPPCFLGFTHNTTSRFMRQAVRDAEGVVPMVLMRQDRCHWLAVWRVQDEDRLAHQLDQAWLQ